MKKIRLIFTISLLITIFNITNVKAFSSADYKNRTLCGIFELSEFKSDGSINKIACYNTYSDAKAAMTTNGSANVGIMTKVGNAVKIIDVNVGLLDLSVNPETLTYFYKNSELTGSSYTYMDTGSLYGGVDGVLIDSAYSNANNVWSAKVGIGDFVGWITQSAYEVVPLAWVKSSSSYTVTSDSIRHNYVAKIQNTYSGSAGSTIGPKPEMLSAGTYYSYDGHYFYKTLQSLIKDARKNSHANAVNKSAPYYNYYMYLSNHTRTTYSSANIDEYIRNNMGITMDAYGNASNGTNSRLYGKGMFFYYAQEKYGVNAILSLSLSRNETANGRSSLAINKNNGFGLNAVDSNPSQAANWYATFASSILGYASKWITYGYAHPKDWRYFGPQFGDKFIGMNVKYASDTYWSEKMAANYYAFDKAKGLQDYNYYQLGVVTKSINAMSSANNSSTFIYNYPEAEDALVIVGETTGESINGNTKWYKIVSDLNVNSNFSEITSGNYNWNSYAYVPAAYVKKINTSKDGYKSPNDVTEYTDKYYTYDLYDDNNTLSPKIGLSTVDANYYYDSALLSKQGQKLLKGRYVMVYAAAYTKSKKIRSYLVTSDYKNDQKHWVSASSIELVSGKYGNVNVSVSGNQYTWVNSTTQDTKETLIGGQYTNSYVPILSQKTVSGQLWYKVPVSLTTTTNQYGWTLAAADGVSIKVTSVTVQNAAPTITATDKTVVQGTTFNPLTGVTATDKEDGNLTSKVTVSTSNVDLNKVGTYNVTYKVTDSNNTSTTKTITVTVTANKKPTITATDKTVTQKTTFNPLEGVTAKDTEDGNLTSKIKVISNNVDINTLGTYEVTYEVTDSFNQKVTKKIVVTVVKSKPPVINANNKTIVINTKYNPLTGVSATDPEEGDLTSKITVTKNTVDSTKLGTYEVVYQVKDNTDNVVTKTIKVTVGNKKQTSGSFYFDYLKIVSNKLQLRGYLTINGMNNTLKENITYKVIFTNTEDNTKVYEQQATRITDISGINRPIYSVDGKTYTHAWFKINIDIDSLPLGNYTMEVQADGDTTYSKALVNNKLYKTEITSYSTETKTSNIKNNYGDGTSSVTLYIRDKNQPLKTVGSYYNQYDIWRTFEFKDNKLHLKGVSYSYGMDLSKNATVKRTIIFENTENYKTYKYSLGSITNGLYKVALPENDNYDKTRAWYDANIDISKIPVGNYKIYISTTSNVTDLSEFTDQLGRDLSSKKITIDNKKYQFKLDLNDGNCIKLEVK